MTLPDWLWRDGHVAWPVFGLLVYSLMLFLGADLVWRLLVLPVRRLLLAVGVAWLVGVVAILLVW